MHMFRSEMRFDSPHDEMRYLLRRKKGSEVIEKFLESEGIARIINATSKVDEISEVLTTLSYGLYDGKDQYFAPLVEALKIRRSRLEACRAFRRGNSIEEKIYPMFQRVWEADPEAFAHLLGWVWRDEVEKGHFAYMEAPEARAKLGSLKLTSSQATKIFDLFRWPEVRQQMSTKHKVKGWGAGFSL
ncbi:hypothetical protein ACYPKM_03525 [Pseudomonas aeruginosa]